MRWMLTIAVLLATAVPAGLANARTKNRQIHYNDAKAHETVPDSVLPADYPTEMAKVYEACGRAMTVVINECVASRLHQQAVDNMAILDRIAVSVSAKNGESGAALQIKADAASLGEQVTALKKTIDADPAGHEKYVASQAAMRRIKSIEAIARTRMSLDAGRALAPLLKRLRADGLGICEKHIRRDLIRLGFSEELAYAATGYVHHPPVGWIDKTVAGHIRAGRAELNGKWVSHATVARHCYRNRVRRVLASARFSVNSALAEPENVYHRIGQDAKTTDILKKQYDVRDRRFRIFVPPKYTGRAAHGLFVHIHTTDLAGGPHKLYTVMEQARMIAICAHGAGKGRSLADIRAPLALDALVNAHLRFNIDPDRVYINGLGDYYDNVAPVMAQCYPDLFKGGVFYSDLVYPHTVNPHLSTRKEFAALFLKQPYCFVVGAKDYNLARFKAAYAAYKSLGMTNVKYMELPNVAHSPPTSREPFVEIVKFLAEHAKANTSR